AAFGRHVEVAAQREPRERVVALAEQRLPAAAYVVARRTIAALRDEGARGDDIGARALAVKTDEHPPPRHEHLAQRAQALDRVREMVQHTHRRDQVEATRERAELRQVGLRMLDIRDVQLARLAL